MATEKKLIQPDNLTKGLNDALEQFVKANQTDDIKTQIRFLPKQLLERQSGVNKAEETIKISLQNRPPVLKKLSKTIKLITAGNPKESDGTWMAQVEFGYDIEFEKHTLCKLIVPHIAYLDEKQWVILHQDSKSLEVLKSWQKNFDVEPKPIFIESQSGKMEPVTHGTKLTSLLTKFVPNLDKKKKEKFDELISYIWLAHMSHFLPNQNDVTDQSQEEDNAILTEDDLDELGIYPDNFELKNCHIELLRKCLISWDITEIGAPVIDPEKPFGSVSVEQTIARAARLDASDTKQIKQVYSEFGYALQAMLWHGELNARNYKVPHPLNGKWSWQDKNSDGYEKIPNPKVIEFNFQEKHRKLLKAATVRWTNWPDEWPDEGLQPTPGIDPKRPYGDRTYFQIDMAEILGLPFDTEAKNPMDKKQEKELLKLHHDMKWALQVFLAKAKIKQGVYGSPSTV